MEPQAGKVEAGLTSDRAAKRRSTLGEPFALGLWARRARAVLTSIQRELRDAEPGQIILCAAMGGFIGAVVDVLREGVAWLHVYDFGISANRYLSEGIGVSRLRLLFVPLLGGLLLGLTARAVRARRFSEIIDPIEANALHGGRCRCADSIWLTFTTVISNAAGASLGMEAGYSQLGAGLYSWAGRWFRLRRADLRIFVTAGAGAAIAAAFNAPLAGAFYGYELILGSYNPRALAPVMVATVCAALTQRGMSHMKALFDVGGNFNVPSESYFLFALLGMVAAAVAVAAMQAVTLDRARLARLQIAGLAPARGRRRAAVGAGALRARGAGQRPRRSAIAFRHALDPIRTGGASGDEAAGLGDIGGLGISWRPVFVGAVPGRLAGRGFRAKRGVFFPALESEHNVFMLAGMGAVAPAIIGAPLTMVFLVLEATGDFQVTIAVVIAVTVASTIVRIFSATPSRPGGFIFAACPFAAPMMWAGSASDGGPADAQRSQGGAEDRASGRCAPPIPMEAPSGFMW